MGGGKRQSGLTPFGLPSTALEKLAAVFSARMSEAVRTLSGDGPGLEDEAVADAAELLVEGEVPTEMAVRMAKGRGRGELARFLAAALEKHAIAEASGNGSGGRAARRV